MPCLHWSATHLTPYSNPLLLLRVSMRGVANSPFLQCHCHKQLWRWCGRKQAAGCWNSLVRITVLPWERSTQDCSILPIQLRPGRQEARTAGVLLLSPLSPPLPACTHLATSSNIQTRQSMLGVKADFVVSTFCPACLFEDKQVVVEVQIRK